MARKTVPHVRRRVRAALLVGLFALASIAVAAEPSTADLERQMADARRRLDEAARQMADLASQLAGAEIQGVTIRHAPHAMLGVTLDGVKVAAVTPGGPAAEAGIRAGDVIVSINGHETQKPHELMAAVRALSPDATADVGYLRDGATKHATVRTYSAFEMWPKMLADLPSLASLPQLKGPLFVHSTSWNDLEVATLSPRLGRYFGTDHGVLVVQAPPDPSLKLEDGDVILAIGDRVPKDGAHALRILGSYRGGESLKLKLMRDHKTLDVEARVPEHGDHDMRDSDMLFMPAMPVPPAPPAPPAPPSSGAPT